MGWAVKRSDGTYRAWFRNTKDEELQAGEIYEELSDPPVIGVPLALQGVDTVRDAYQEARLAMEQFAGDSTMATARTALIKLGLCVEELLIALNRYQRG